jgi:hypothetical protein
MPKYIRTSSGERGYDSHRQRMTIEQVSTLRASKNRHDHALCMVKQQNEKLAHRKFIG